MPDNRRSLKPHNPDGRQLSGLNINATLLLTAFLCAACSVLTARVLVITPDGRLSYIGRVFLYRSYTELG